MLEIMIREPIEKFLLLIAAADEKRLDKRLRKAPGIFQSLVILQSEFLFRDSFVGVRRVFFIGYTPAASKPHTK